MEIRWSNVLAIGLVVLAVVVGSRHLHEMGAMVATMKHMADPNDAEARIIGLATFGFIMVCLLGALRIILNANNRSEK